MADDWDISEEECARLEREARTQLEIQKAWSSQGGSVQELRTPDSCQFRSEFSAASFSNSSAQSGIRPFVVNVFSVSDDKIGTRSSFHKGLKDSLKSVEGSLWDGSQRSWIFPKAKLDQVIQVIQQFPGLKSEVQLSPDLLPLHRSMQLNRSLSKGVTTIAQAPCSASTPSTQSPDTCNLQPPGSHSSQKSSSQEAQPSREHCQVTGRLASTTQHAREPPATCRQLDERQGKLEYRVLKLEPFCGGAVKVTFRHHEALSKAIGHLNGAQKLHDNRHFEEGWVVPFREIEKIRSLSTSIEGVNIQVQDLQPLQSRVLEDFSSLSDERERFNHLPPGLQGALMPFQREGILFGLSRGGRMLCADEMGLGKTVQALGLAACYKDEWPVLVLVPSSLRLHWAMSICKWLSISPFEVTVLIANSSSATSRDGFEFVRCSKDSTVELKGQFNVVSYDLIDRVANSFKVVIADESHYLKNYKAKRTNICCPRLQKAKRAMLLTGTPALSRPIDLYKQLEALQPKAYRNIKEYGERYCQGSIFGQYSGSSNMDELHKLLSSTIMIRRLKNEVLPQLPAKCRQQIVLMLSDKAMSPVKKIMKQLEAVRAALKQLPDEGEQAAQTKMKEQALISQLYQKTAEAKIDSVQDYLANLIETKTKFLVFAHHLSVLNAIETLVKDGTSKTGYIRIDGSTPHDKRQVLVEKFQRESTVTVAILAIRAAGVGLTLTSASTVVFAELAWNPGELIQAEDRAHRIGQDNSVNVYYLHAPETADDIIWHTVQNKLGNLGQALDGQHNTWSLERCRQQEASQNGDSKQVQLKIGFSRSSSGQPLAGTCDKAQSSGQNIDHDSIQASERVPEKDYKTSNSQASSQSRCGLSSPHHSLSGGTPVGARNLEHAPQSSRETVEGCSGSPLQQGSNLDGRNTPEEMLLWGVSCKRPRTSPLQS